MAKAIIVITTYNLEKYIAQALDSVLCQKTNFEFKIIVADDCSTDQTISILNDYKQAYPNRIELVLATENLGSLRNSNRIFDGLQCDYFSFLDGDDYWVGEDRLQKQVDFLDAHPEYILCGGNTQYLRNDRLSEMVVDQSKLGQTYSFTSMLDNSIPFVHTSALLERNVVFNRGLPDCYKQAENTFENCALRGEDFRRILHLERGPMYVMKDVVSVYRIHEKGMWQGSSSAKRAIEGAISANFYKKYFGDRYGSYFAENARKQYRNMMTTLVLDRDFLGNYELNANETYLLVSLLSDMKKDTCNKIERSAITRKILKKVISKLIIK